MVCRIFAINYIQLLLNLSGNNVYVCMYVCMYMYVHIYVCVCVCVCVYVGMYVWCSK